MKEVMRYPAGVEKDDFKFAATARTELDRSMKASGAKSDLQLATTLKKKTKSLLALDPIHVRGDFAVRSAVWRWQ